MAWPPTRFASPATTSTHTLCDIETLNRRAQDEAFFDVTAISFHAYPYLQQNYTLMGCGGSVGEGYGPMIVSSKPLTLGGFEPHQDRRSRHADHRLSRAQDLQSGACRPRPCPSTRSFRRFWPATYEAGLIIHEGQLTYSASGLNKILDLGVWWREKTGLMLPLGGNAIRRSLGAEKHKIISKALRESIQHALDHREQALEYAMQFARDLDVGLASRFVSMYVNQRTLDYGADGREAIRKLLEMGHERGIIPIAPQVDFVD